MDILSTASWIVGSLVAVVLLIRLMKPKAPGKKWGSFHVNLNSKLSPKPEWLKKRRGQKPGTRCRSLVTGGTGFVGRHLVDALVERGDIVTVTDRVGPCHRDDVDFVKADIRDKEMMLALCKDQDVVFHNASLVHTKKSHRKLIWEVNLDGSKNIVEGCLLHSVPRLVYVSTASANYDGKDICDGDESLPYATTYQAHYSASKIEAEKYVLAASGSSFTGAGAKGTIATCALRPHVIFGPGDTRFMPALLDRSTQSALRFAVGQEKKKSDFTFVVNLTDACLLADENLAAGSKMSGRPYFITNEDPRGFFDFINRILRTSGLPTFDYTMPDCFMMFIGTVWEAIDMYIFGGMLNSERGLSSFSIRYMCTHHYFSCAAAREHFGFVPRVSLEDGVKHTSAAIRATLAASVQ